MKFLIEFDQKSEFLERVGLFKKGADTFQIKLLRYNLSFFNMKTNQSPSRKVLLNLMQITRESYEKKLLLITIFFFLITKATVKVMH